MNPAIRLAAFAAILALVFALGAALGAAVGPDPVEPSAPAERHGTTTTVAGHSTHSGATP